MHYVSADAPRQPAASVRLVRWAYSCAGRSSCAGRDAQAGMRLHPKISPRSGTERRAIVLAEREGFEPSMELLTPYSLSRGAPSAARPSLHVPCASSTGRYRYRLGLTSRCAARFGQQLGGGGGIRTPETCVWRFSRPLPSTTRPLLQRTTRALWRLIGSRTVKGPPPRRYLARDASPARRGPSLYEGAATDKRLPPHARGSVAGGRWPPAVCRKHGPLPARGTGDSRPP